MGILGVTLTGKWTEEQERNAAFRTEITAAFNSFKNDVNSQITAFKTTMQTQQNEFEAHIISLFTDFTTDEQSARSDFEANFQQLFEQWKVDTLKAFDASLNIWKHETTDYFNTLIEEKTKDIEIDIKTWVQTGGINIPVMVTTNTAAKIGTIGGATFREVE